MGKINWARVILGGLLAGVVINIFEIVGAVVLQPEWAAAFELLGLAWEPTSTQVIVFLLLHFALGIAFVWLYAAARPRFGPGPKTAACIGFACGFIGFAYPTIGWGIVLGLSTRLLAIVVVWGVVEFVAATLVGAWPYKE